MYGYAMSDPLPIFSFQWLSFSTIPFRKCQLISGHCSYFHVQFCYVKKCPKALWPDLFRTSTVEVLRALHYLNTTINAVTTLI